jgi:hypothetical protein
LLNNFSGAKVVCRKSVIVFTDGIELRWGSFGWGNAGRCDLYHLQDLMRAQSGEPIEIIYHDQFFPDGISKLAREYFFRNILFNF